MQNRYVAKRNACYRKWCEDYQDAVEAGVGARTTGGLRVCAEDGEDCTGAEDGEGSANGLCPPGVGDADCQGHRQNLQVTTAQNMAAALDRGVHTAEPGERKGWAEQGVAWVGWGQARPCATGSPHPCALQVKGSQERGNEEAMEAVRPPGELGMGDIGLGSGCCRGSKWRGCLRTSLRTSHRGLQARAVTPSTGGGHQGPAQLTLSVPHSLCTPAG